MGIKIVCNNKKAYHDYFIDETVEAGIMLTGTEVKSLRDGKGNLKDCYALIKDGEAWVLGFHISPYSHGNINNPDPLRTRKLLLHKKEIERLSGKIKEKGMAVVALKVYFKDGRAKLELGLARGKKQYDKREAMKERSDQREIERAMKVK
ncbi:MAG: SsrA-binding protein SmpB [Nitrospirae bacterium]|nr:SsrA-binding protein SmpB [Nitrospirota bacterium]